MAAEEVAVSEYQLMEPFDIDNGELVGATPVDAFVLGVEWATFRQLLRDNIGPFDHTVHRKNAERLVRMCARRGRTFRLQHTDDTWTFISIGGTPISPEEGPAEA